MTLAYYAVGTTLANMTNIEASISEAPHSLEGNRIPLLGPIERRSFDNTVTMTGAIDAPLLVDTMTQSAMRSLINDTFGGYSVASKALYVTAIAENGYYLPFSVTLLRPREREHYTVVNSYHLRDISIPGYGWVLQSATKTSNYTVTTSDHYLKANTASGSITFALPALSGVVENVPYTFEKTSASNNMVLDPNSTETINGASTLTVTALNAVTTIIKSGSQWVTI